MQTGVPSVSSGQGEGPNQQNSTKGTSTSGSATNGAEQVSQNVPSTNMVASRIDVMNTLQCIPLGLVTPALLHARIKRHFDAHKAAYDSENYFMRPKWHLSLHLSEHLRRFGTLLSCFTLERRHKALKLLARHTTNTRAFEKSCTIDMLLHHLGELNRPDSLARGTCLLEGLMFSLISVNEQ